MNLLIGGFKKFFVFLFFLGTLAQAQLLSVTATLTDGDGTLWVNATCSIQLYSPNGSATYNGTAIPTQPACSVNSSGVLSASLYNTSTLTPVTAQYQFVIASKTSAVASSFTTPITAANSTALLSSLITAPRFITNFGAFGYADVEAVPTMLGGMYYNIITPATRQCTAISAGLCTSWISLSSTTGTVSNITSTGNTITVSNGAGPTTNLEVKLGTYYQTSGYNPETGIVLTNNKISCAGFVVPPSGLSVGHVTLDIRASDTGNADIGFYNATGTLEAHIGAQVISGTGNNSTFAFTGGTQVLIPGKTYFCLTVTNASPTLAVAGNVGAQTFYTYQNTGITSTGGVLPTTITPPADAVTTAGTAPSFVLAP